MRLEWGECNVENTIQQGETIVDNKLTYYPEAVILKVFEHVTEGILITDKYKRIELVNPSFEFVTGYRQHEIIGSTPAILNSGMHDKDYYDAMWNTIEEKGMWQGEIWNRRKTGEIYPEFLKIMAIKDKEGTITNYCGIFTDLSEQKNVEDELEKRALTDTLTNVSNRHSFLERMNTLLESSSTIPDIQHAVYVLDLDRFKQVNDSLGHVVADSILIEVAKRIQLLIKNKDIIARYGGDEFIITVTNIESIREAAQFAELLIATIQKPIYMNNEQIFVSSSIGVSLYPMDGMKRDELVNKAVKAMTFAKSNGRNSYSFYFDDLNTDSKRTLLLDTELRKAIKNKDFELYFQPKIETATNNICGVEALVRWHNDKLGFVSPNEFIPYAEETGLIVPLSEIIFEKACEAQIELDDILGFNISIAINVSSIHFQQQNFIETIKNILNRYHVHAKHFHIEVTERAVLNSAAETVAKFVKLKQLGFKLAIDDFGTGYSSLSYLVRFPLDYLKIDRSFIQHISSLDEKQAIVDAIIQMSHRLKLKVVAEGVEQLQQVEILRKLRCDILQGYYYSKPLPFDELLEFLAFWEEEHSEGVVL